MYEIFKITSASPVDFAAEELKKYMRMMMPRCGSISIKYDKDAKSGIRLGLMQDFGIDVSEADDTFLDDIIHLEKTENGQIIAGSNPRSVLLAVYKFLKINGCRWLFPGVDGESIPVKEIEYVNYHKMADNRYRGQCNEGSTHQQNYLDAIDFVPKIGMNIYMLEFDIPTCYYKKWLNHDGNPYLKPEPFTPEQILQWKRECECEIEKRGLQFHDMGHGWTSAAFGQGLAAGSWSKVEVDISDEDRKYLPLMEGKRDLFHNVIANTNICMSNPEARKKMINAICDYAAISNNVDFLHVWLADGRNNHCECEECQKMIPSDYYVILLNELDEELTRRNLSTHIVFISYTDTIYGPLVEKIKNYRRFSLLFAPISRKYTESYLEDSTPEICTPYMRNKCVIPRGVGVCMAYRDEWNRAYEGDVMCYEYHFWKAHMLEPSYQHIAKNIYDDIHGLKKHKLNGIIEDQTPRNYMPSGFAQTVFGEALFDLDLKFEDLEKDYYEHAFGENWEKVRDFLNSIFDPDVFDGICTPPIVDGKACYINHDLPEKIKDWPEKCDAFLKVIDENQNHVSRPQQVLWKNLYLHNKLVKYDYELFCALFTDDKPRSAKYFKEMEDEFGLREFEFQKYFDLGEWDQIIKMQGGAKRFEGDTSN